MKYLGSKAKIASEIVSLILQDHPINSWYVEPFCGGANTLIHAQVPNRLANDLNPYLIALLQAVADYWKPPEAVCNYLYSDIKNRPEKYPAELVGFVGFAASFGGKFFGGYARGENNFNEERNYAKEVRKSLMNERQFLQDISWQTGDYLILKIPPNSTIYCDPPYTQTTKHNSFSSVKFWKWCEAKTKEGHRVFVSEYTAPRNWNCIWERKITSNLAAKGYAKISCEKLFTIE